MLEKNDWRLVNQQEYLMNAELSKSSYKSLNENWEHYHCAFCWDKFSEKPKDLNSGYCTKDKKSIGFAKSVLTISKKCLISS